MQRLLRKPVSTVPLPAGSMIKITGFDNPSSTIYSYTVTPFEYNGGIVAANLRAYSTQTPFVSPVIRVVFFTLAIITILSNRSSTLCDSSITKR